MKKLLLILAGAVICCAGVFAQGSDQSCTSIMVGRLASKDGAVITSHTCDGKYRTWSFMEPAADHEPGALHALQKGTLKTAFRGDTTGVVTLGYIFSLFISLTGSMWLFFRKLLSVISTVRMGKNNTPLDH